MSNTYYDEQGQQISKEEFSENLRLKTNPTPKMTYTGVTVYPDGREEVVERTEKGGEVIRTSTRRTGYEVTDQQTGETQTLYTSQLPAGQRQQLNPNVSATATIDPNQQKRFVQVIDTKGRVRENYYYDTQRGASVSKKERDRIIGEEGDKRKIKVTGEISPKNPDTSTTTTRIIEDFEMPSFYEAATGKKAKVTTFGEDIIKAGAREQRDIVINRPYLIPIAAGTGALAGGFGVVAPKIATGIAFSGKAALATSLGVTGARAGMGAFGLTDENPADVIGSTAGSLALLGTSAGAGARAGTFTATKLFPVQTSTVSVTVPKQTSVRRDVLTERLTAKQVIDLSKKPAPLSKSQVIVRREVPDNAIDSFTRFGRSYSAPDFGSARTSTTKIITERVPASNIPRVKQDYDIIGRLTPKGVQQVRAFQPIVGKKGSSLAFPSFTTDTGVISTQQPSFSVFPSSRFATVPTPRTTVLFPAVTSGRTSTRTIEEVNTVSQPINLSTETTKTTDLVDFKIGARTSITTDTGATPQVTSSSLTTATATTESPALPATPSPAPMPKRSFTPRFKLPVSPSFNMPPLPSVFSGIPKPTKKASVPRMRKPKALKVGKTRKSKDVWEGIFSFKGLNLDLSRRKPL